jgi:hypothetical protein
MPAMSMSEPPATALPSRRFLRFFVLAAASTQTTFWFYTFHFIDVNSNPMGDGLEWMAVFPFGFVFFGLVFPALLLGAIGRLLRFGALLASAGLVLNVVVFLEIVGEMTSHAAHHLKF